MNGITNPPVCDNRLDVSSFVKRLRALGHSLVLRGDNVRISVSARRIFSVKRRHARENSMSTCRARPGRRKRTCRCPPRGRRRSIFRLAGNRNITKN